MKLFFIKYVKLSTRRSFSRKHLNRWIEAGLLTYSLFICLPTFQTPHPYLRCRLSIGGVFKAVTLKIKSF